MTKKRIVLIVLVIVAIALIGGCLANYNSPASNCARVWGQGSFMYNQCLQANQPCNPNANPQQLTCDNNG